MSLLYTQAEPPLCLLPFGSNSFVQHHTSFRSLSFSAKDAACLLLFAFFVPSPQTKEGLLLHTHMMCILSRPCAVLLPPNMLKKASLQALLTVLAGVSLYFCLYLSNCLELLQKFSGLSFWEKFEHFPPKHHLYSKGELSKASQFETGTQHLTNVCSSSQEEAELTGHHQAGFLPIKHILNT